MSIEVSRRRFLLGLAGLIAAPAIVKVASLMPLRGQVLISPKESYDFLYNYLYIRPEWAIYGTSISMEEFVDKYPLHVLSRADPRRIRPVRY